MSIVEGGITTDPTAMKRTEEIMVFRKVGSDVKIMGTYGKWPQNIDD